MPWETTLTQVPVAPPGSTWTSSITSATPPDISASGQPCHFSGHGSNATMRLTNIFRLCLLQGGTQVSEVPPEPTTDVVITMLRDLTARSKLIEDGQARILDSFGSLTSKHAELNATVTNISERLSSMENRDPFGPPCEPWPTPSSAGRLQPYMKGPATSCCSGSFECQHHSCPITAVLNTSKLLSKAFQDIEGPCKGLPYLGKLGFIRHRWYRCDM
ncbi:hypothetical protein HPB51_009537 [Rhipicephalus microplus]|uniref:Uncharacterized protein n=1 Tax=Rhipicephalus microplus TaxID=6941 RepID=A0A9J6F0X9_RHIMP|nr:hypothetical protein HPB51_009537 [Rhipicephalus microplus]